jgi:hypothetical protein
MTRWGQTLHESTDSITEEREEHFPAGVVDGFLRVGTVIPTWPSAAITLIVSSSSACLFSLLSASR